jgi:two-component system, chemotaxis family, protein-glutamate methylesterase/glutaminase
MTKPVNAILIGGSAGSFQVVISILSLLPKNFPLPVILCLHRLKSIRSGFVEALSFKSAIPVIEPYDKEFIRPGLAYIAPANYHLYIEDDFSFALSTEDPVNHSRPSIDVTFKSAALAYGPGLTGIVLSGANSDGAEGLYEIKTAGGTTIIQDPNESEVNIMPLSCLEKNCIDNIFTTKQIINYLHKVF